MQLSGIICRGSGSWSPGSPAGSLGGMSPSGAYSPASEYGTGLEGLSSPGYSPTSPTSPYGSSSPAYGDGVMSPRYSPTSPSKFRTFVARLFAAFRKGKFEKKRRKHRKV